MKISKTLLVATTLLSSAACSGPATSVGAVESQAAAKSPAAEAVYTSPGKPSAAANVSFVSTSRSYSLGAPASVRAVVTPTADVDSLEVRFGLSDGLSASGALPNIVRNAQSAGVAAVTQDIVLVPNSEGMQYLSVFVTTMRGSQRMDKAVSFPIAVGNAALKSPAVSTGPGGERVISTPAGESH